MPCDVRVPGDDRVQLMLRLYICQIVQVCSHHTADLDAGVPARGLNGEAYRTCSGTSFSCIRS